MMLHEAVKALKAEKNLKTSCIFVKGHKHVCPLINSVYPCKCSGMLITWPLLLRAHLPIPATLVTLSPRLYPDSLGFIWETTKSS